MEFLLSATFWLKVIEIVGLPGVFIFLIFMIRKSDEARMDKQEASREKERVLQEATREKDRVEHKAKWDSMIDQHQDERNRHKEELDRIMKLFERQISAVELQANLLARMNDKIDTNQFCPIVKEQSNG